MKNNIIRGMVDSYNPTTKWGFIKYGEEQVFFHKKNVLGNYAIGRGLNVVFKIGFDEERERTQAILIQEEFFIPETTVKCFGDKKYGFLKNPHGDIDIFVYYDAITNNDYLLKEGQKVRCFYIKTTKGLEATLVTII